MNTFAPRLSEENDCNRSWKHIGRKRTEVIEDQRLDDGPHGDPEKTHWASDDFVSFLLPAEGPNEIGRLGEYRIVEVLGVGGMGVVYRAEDLKLKRPVALKVMKPTVASKATAKERFLQEARAAAAIDHQNIVTIHQVGEDRDIPFIAMRYLRGESLQKRLNREQKLSLWKTIQIGKQIATGLAAAHEKGLIHRDIKPDNIWIEEKTGCVKILDFGLARPIDGDSGLTQSGMLIGTPKYMSPEQALANPIDHRSDLFSLGVVLYHLLSGQAPFEGESVTATLLKVSQSDYEPLSDVCPGLQSNVIDLVARLLEKDPTRRPQSANEVAEALTAIEISLDSEDEMVGSFELADTEEILQSPDSSNRPNTDSETEESKSRLPLVVYLLMTLVGLTCFGFWASTFFVRVKLDDGTLVIKVDSDDFEAAIKGKTVVIRNTETDAEYSINLDRANTTKRLAPGDYEFLVTNRDGFRTSTDRFQIGSSEQKEVEVWWEPSIGDATPPSISSRPTPSANPSLNDASQPAVQPTRAIAPFSDQEAKQYQQVWADHLGLPVQKEINLGNDVILKMVLIPPGEFLMGSTHKDLELPVSASADMYLSKGARASMLSEQPQHRVVISLPFYMSVYESTQSQFGAFVEETKYVTAAEKEPKGGWGHKLGHKRWTRNPSYDWRTEYAVERPGQRPVVNVSWHDANAFCDWLSSKEQDLMFCLPTEAQYEFSCRAGTTTWWPSPINENSEIKASAHIWCSPNPNCPQPVGMKAPNSFGLHDMLGNVREWCSDWYDPHYYQTSLIVDPTGPKNGTLKSRRGGAFHSHPLGCRSPSRSGTPPDFFSFFGFRVSAQINPQKINAVLAPNEPKVDTASSEKPSGQP